MNTAELNALLIETAIASSVAIALVLLLRRPLRVRFGAAIAYAAWLLVPAALIAVLLPAATTASAPVATLALGNAMPQVLATEAATGIDRTLLWVAVWSLGALGMAMYFAMQQRRFRRALGALRARADGLQQASSTGGLPAAFGLLRPRIVVPADFDHRYSAEQQALMRAHERSHIRSGDLHANALVAALRCLFWFNPLVHLASRHFRHDQELACDQRVIARHPQSRRAYGEAMFKTQLAAQPLPLGCHWGYSHPLRERIEMLKQPVPTKSRWSVGAMLMTSLILATGTAAWAAQPARSTAVSTSAGLVGIKAEGTLQVDGGERRNFAIVNKVGEPFSLRVEQGGHLWEVLATATVRDNGMIDLRTRLLRDDVLVGEPGLTAKEGELSVIRYGDGPGTAPEFHLGIVLASGALASLMPSPPSPPAPPAPLAPQLPPPPAPAPPPPPPAPPSPPAAPILTPPLYPKQAKEARVEGVVVLVVDVAADGTPTEVVVERSEPVGVFDQAAVDAVKKWQFTPELENGKPVAGRVRVPVEFRIPPSKAGAGKQAG